MGGLFHQMGTDIIIPDGNSIQLTIFLFSVTPGEVSLLGFGGGVCGRMTMELEIIYVYEQPWVKNIQSSHNLKDGHSICLSINPGLQCFHALSLVSDGRHLRDEVCFFIRGVYQSGLVRQYSNQTPIYLKSLYQTWSFM